MSKVRLRVCTAVVMTLVLTSCNGDGNGSTASVNSSSIDSAPAASATEVTDAAIGDSTDTTTATEPTNVGSVAPTIPIPTFDPDDLPALPPPAPISGIAAAERVAQLVAATDDAAVDDGGWPAVYAELAVPISDSTAVATPGADPIGPRWETVWAVGRMSRGASTIALPDVARALGWDSESPADVERLLADLRAAATSPDPRLQTLGLFVAAKSVANGGDDFVDPAVLADQVRFDAATMQLLVWVVARDVLATVLPPSLETTPGSTTETTAGLGRVARLGGGTPCSEALGTAEQTSWINYVVGKIGGGVGIEGVVSLPGLVELWATKITALSKGAEAGKAAGERAAAVINKLNLAASLLSLIAQVNALAVNTVINPDPLVRHRQASDGDTAEVRVDISFDSSRFDGNDAGFCLLSLLSNALGVGLSVPADGAKLSGVEVVVTPGQNFPDKVYFSDGGEPRRVTDQSGSITIGVQGRARSKTLPESAKEIIDEFGLSYAAQVEEVTTQSLLNVFIDGLSLAKGGFGGAIDIAKTLHYDLGEFAYRFKDYLTGYRISQTWIGGYELSGEVCDLEQAFVIQADGSGVGGYVGELTITPSADGQVAYELVGKFGGQLAGHGSGTGTLTVSAEQALVTLTGGQFVATFPGIGDLPVGEGGAHFAGAESDPILLYADPTTCGGS